MKTITSTLLALLIALLFLPAGAARAAGDSQEELRKRFAERFPQIRELKQTGVVGETDEGYLDFVKDQDEKAAGLVEDENDDRKALYRLIGEKEKVDPEVVAKRNAKRNFDRAKPGEHLRQGGKWTKKGG